MLFVITETELKQYKKFMKDKKIKILFAPSDGAGVGHFRSIWPAQQMEKEYSDEIYVEINSDFVSDPNYYKQFDIVHFHRQLGPYEGMQALVTELRKSGVIVIMDIDDYWIPPKTHPLYIAAIKDKLPEKITAAFKLVDYVTTTTDIYAGHIRKYNHNVHVIPNAIDLNHRMWKDVDTKKTDKLRFSWIGGSSHLNDLEILQPSMNILHNDKSLQEKYQLVMCGYDVRGFMTEVDQDGKHVNTRKILPSETVWNRFEEIFTNNYNPNVISEDYKKYLLKYSNEEYKGADVYKGPYIRRWTLPLTRYGEHYNFCDVCLAPLAENTFNEVKSELKIIEAGLKRKVLIAQDYSVYKELITNGVNGILINKKNNTRGWYEAIKYLINHPEKVKELSDNLYDFVIKRYTLDIVTKQRVEFYKDIIKQKETENQQIPMDANAQ